MAYRYGIPQALDDDGLRFGREAIDEEPQPFTRPLTCGECSAAVTTMRSHSRSGQHGATVPVAAHYRLKPEGQHDDGCRYDFERRAQGIQQDSHGTVERKQGQWRLLLPTDAEAAAANDPALRAGEHRPRKRLHIERTDSDPLEPALTSARAIARLLADAEDDPELVEQFAATYNGHTIQWPDFYYGDTKQEKVRLHEKLALPLQHPVAVSGTLHALRQGKSGANHAALARGSIWSPTGWIPVVLRASTPDLLPREPGQQWLAYGKWQRWNSPTSNYGEVQLWVHGRWQLTTW